MFRTFRIRLLFWFLVFISSSFVIILLSITYLQKREAIFTKTEAIEQAYLFELKAMQAQLNFFAYETKSKNYFENGKSEFLDQYQVWKDSTIHTLESADFTKVEDINQVVLEAKNVLNQTDSLFTYLTEKVAIRGYKDFSLEGSMREDAHWLENTKEIPKEMLLTLRRHEKDYIIRNESQYLQKFDQAKASLEKVIQKARIETIRKNTVLSYLNSYQDKFNKLVELDKEIGIKDNSGLKRELDQKFILLEANFSKAVDLTRDWAKKEFDNLTLYFGITVILLVLFSIVISAFIAHKITSPLKDLTDHITRFVESNFTLETEHPMVKSKDEIGSLTKHFTILKNEVVSQMKFFKQRVEERTEALAKANIRLEKISEANSRFVPKEFLNNLGKDSIEEVSLGDYVDREMTIVFTDIRNFTKISEGLSPQENFDFLNKYLGGIVPIIEKHGGFIDKFIGDSVMALFPNSSDHAIDALLEFEQFLEQFNVDIKTTKGMPPISVGSGVHTGKLILGTIGHDNRLETTVISDAVNTAARVEGLTKYYQSPLVVTQATIERMDDPSKFSFRFLDKVKVKGKSETLSVYEILAPHHKTRIAYNEDYQKAIDMIEAGNSEDGISIFEKLLAINPSDKAIKRLIEKFKNPNFELNQGWKEVTKMTNK